MMCMKYLLLICVCCEVLRASNQKPLTTLLRSSWGYTPFLLEACEFLWEYNEDVFWKFVNSSKALGSADESDQEVYNSAIDVAEELLPPAIYNAFLFSLSLHVYSPTVQLFQQLSMEAHSKLVAGEGCAESDVFVEVDGTAVCSVEVLQQMLQLDIKSRDPPDVFDFDHKYPCGACTTSVPLLILYGQLGTADFAMFHSTLSELAASEKIVYIFRHFYKSKSSDQSLLSGYGVQLTVKNTEYKAVDDTQVEDTGEHVLAAQEEQRKEVSGFAFSTLHARYPDMTSDLKEFEDHLLQGSRELPDLKLWQLQDLGFQAAQRVIAAGSEFALSVLKDLSQNLPILAKGLYKVQVDKNLRKEIESNQKALVSVGVSPGQSIIFLNGVLIRAEESIYQLFELLLSETLLLDRLSSLGIDPGSHAGLLAMSVHGPESSQVVLDVRSKAVVFINDLEKDRVYRSWAKSLREFLRPTYPGMLRQIARNAFNIVFLLDPLSAAGVEMVEYLKLFLDHMVPARLGLVLLPEGENEGAVAVCRAFAFLSVKLSPREGLRWLVKVQEQFVLAKSNWTAEDVSDIFLQVFAKTLKDVSVEDVFSAEWDSYRKEAEAFYSAKGFSSPPQVLVNGVQLDLLEEDIETAIVSRMQYQTFEIQQAVFNNKLKDKDNVYDFFLDRPHVLSRVNRHVLAKSQVIDLSHPILLDSSSSFEAPVQTSAKLASTMTYLSKPESEFITKALSVWIVADLDTQQGRQMLLDALQYLIKSESIRVGVIHNSEDSPSVLSRAVQAVLMEEDLAAGSVITFLQALLGLSELVGVSDLVRAARDSQLDPEKITAQLFSSEVNSTLSEHMLFIRIALKLGAGQNIIVCNGKLVGPLSEGEVFGEEDWKMLTGRETQAYADNLVAVVNALEVNGLSPDDDTSSYRSDLVMKLASLLRSHPKRNRYSEMPKLSDRHSAVHLPPLEADMYLTVVAFLDPLSADTQRFAPILQTLHAAFSMDVTIYLNPRPKLSQMPISSFYRYVLQPELNFNVNGSLQENAVAVFSDLPTSPLFTLSLDVPHSWLVEPVFSPHDLDNIHLAQLPEESSIHAEFMLEYILVEGQCFDVRSDQPTPGLQFVLGSATHPDLFDTIVMANLGYFQLKAGPGAWLMRLREGRSRELYDIHSYSTSDGNGRMEESLKNEISINVGNFGGTAVTVRVGKKEGMERVELLEETPSESGTAATEEGENLWSTLSNLLHSSGNIEASQEEVGVAVNETINVFSIASGHLYERFLRIMMLSVLNHTRNPVKFWFLKNFLSPTFKGFISHMARHYGFEYELVEYKWPRWLHAQTQKQRLIWGYKILFLDVLFPLSVKKIIFVDADQIVRADLRELLEIPLEGAPYAYTPFCDSRPDMEGFRFWEKGYWKGHLGNRRYHISALYVVDLVSFRHLAAGDRLRGQYQALSQDPNSLSNLDQDLPNNMIHSVPIKSLPQEWLWCETWCSQESKPQAKTIDLCNNPLTKEPKLQSAMRIVPEWTAYDEEIKALWAKTDDINSKATGHHQHTEL